MTSDMWVFLLALLCVVGPIVYYIGYHWGEFDI